MSNNKLRKALEVMLEWYYELHDDVAAMDKAMETARNALAEPLKNCEVGTVREQDLRFDDFCNSHKGCDKCPLKKGVEACALGWAHMPYESEVKG